MKLLFVIDRLGGAVGGAERVLCEVASALAERGHEVAVASFDAETSQDSYPLASAVLRHHLRPASCAGALGAVLVRPATLRPLLKASTPEVAIGFMASAYVPLGIAALGTRVPIIASEHTAYDHFRARPTHAFAVRSTAPLFAAFTTTSERVRAGFPKAIARRMVAIPNPVSLKLHGKIARDGGRRTLLSVGNLRREKGHRILVSAFGQVAAEFPDWDLRIVGDGPERGALERQVGVIGLNQRVDFAGTVTDVVVEYAAADLFAMPSAYESFGIAAAEALAAGVPVVGFADCPGTNELVEHGTNGLLVAGPDRVAALADGLAQLMASPERRSAMAAAGPASVGRFSLTAIADRWEHLLRDVAAR